MKVHKLFILLIVLSLASLALAQSLGDVVGFNFQQFYLTSAAFGLAIAGIVKFLKERTVWLQGNYTLVIVFAISIILSLAGYLLGWQGENTLAEALSWGISGAINAIITHNLLSIPKNKKSVETKPVAAPELPTRRG